MDGGLWHCTGDRDQDHAHGKEMQKSKMAVWGGLKIAVKRREVKSKGEKERYRHLDIKLPNSFYETSIILKQISQKNTKREN